MQDLKMTDKEHYGSGKRKTKNDGQTFSNLRTSPWVICIPSNSSLGSPDLAPKRHLDCFSRFHRTTLC